MLARHMRRRPNINPTLFQCIVLMGSCYSQQAQNICITFVQRRHNVFDIGPALYVCFVLTGLNAAQLTRGIEPVLV